MDRVDYFVLLDQAQFSRSSVTHRNRIKTPQGSLLLTVPIQNNGNPSIRQTMIAADPKWRHKHWHQIVANYRRAPYWNLYGELLEEIYTQQWHSLAQLNIRLIQAIKETLSIHTPLILESELKVEGVGGNYRNLNICERLNATIYLSGDGARVYNDEQLYRERGLELRYHQFQHPVYRQLWGEFIPQLSIIDLLFNCGPASLEIIRQARTS